MSAFLALIGRDLRREWQSGAWWQPVAFFMLVALLYPFAVGPRADLLRITGGGIMWVAALLAALNPIDRLFAPDKEAGVIDQLVLRGFADEVIVAARLVSHWIGFAWPLLLATIPGAVLLGLPVEAWQRLALGLLLGSPGLAALGVIVAAVTLGTRGSGALAGLLLLPLAVPVLIFGAAMTGPSPAGAPLFLAAASLLLVAIAPFAGGAALRGARDG